MFCWNSFADRAFTTATEAFAAHVCILLWSQESKRLTGLALQCEVVVKLLPLLPGMETGFGPHTHLAHVLKCAVTIIVVIIRDVKAGGCELYVPKHGPSRKVSASSCLPCARSAAFLLLV